MTVTEAETKLKEGRVVGIAGPVIDVEFPSGSLPEINTAVEFTVTVDGRPRKVVGAQFIPMRPARDARANAHAFIGRTAKRFGASDYG